MNWQGAFKVLIRIIFIFAYIAFLAASIRHVATFFHNFEADQTDWANPYTLAVSIDLTALVLTVGVMFFRGNMPWYAQGFTWMFIVALTGFSWFVNWEYARTFQGNDLHVDDNLRMLNPILASSFAFLNLAYSVVAEFFSAKKKTAEELAAEIAELEEMEQHQIRLAEYKERTKKPSLIARAKATALEAREAVKEVVKKEEDERNVVAQVSPSLPGVPAQPALNIVQSLPQIEHETPPSLDVDTDPVLEKVLYPEEEKIDRSFAADDDEDEGIFDRSFDDLQPEDAPIFPRSFEPTTGDLVKKDNRKITRPLDPKMQERFVATSLKDAASNRKAMSKDEAAQYLECSVKDVEKLIRSGKITMYGNSKVNVLASSVKDYTPPRKKNTKVNA